MALEDLDREELLKVMARDRQVKGEFIERIAALTSENAELHAIITELDSEVAMLRELTASVESPATDV
jgi:hypothetical protein